jgi:hypothetical protein
MFHRPDYARKWEFKKAWYADNGLFRTTTSAPATQCYLALSYGPYAIGPWSAETPRREDGTAEADHLRGDHTSCGGGGPYR